MSSEKIEEKVAEFQRITSVDDRRVATRCLRLSDWNVERATYNYLVGSSSNMEESSASVHTSAAAKSTGAVAETLHMLSVPGRGKFLSFPRNYSGKGNYYTFMPHCTSLALLNCNLPLFQEIR